MPHVITIPASLDDQTFEHVLEQVAQCSSDAQLVMDARNTTWASPYGLVALLTLAQSCPTKPQLRPPENGDTASIWSRACFYRYAEDVFEILGNIPAAGPEPESSTMLEITHITSRDDVDRVIEIVQAQLVRILLQYLHLESRAVLGFAVTVSAACRHMLNASEQGGWIAAQAYNYRKHLGLHVVQIALSDAGIGIRRSLERRSMRPAAERFDDGAALETVLIGGTSRFLDDGRGQGFKGLRGYLRKWNGKLAVRSGTARVADVPAWDDDVVRRDRLAPMAGTQLLMVIPEQV